jgi:pimeloyl-ACP methyl ester carboxylesterase
MARKCPSTRLILALLICLLAVPGALGIGGPVHAGTTRRQIAVLELPGGKSLSYFISTPADPSKISEILISIQGYTRDANRTFDASAKAAAEAGHESNTLIVAPIFQVPESDAPKCHFRNMPSAGPNDALWRCGNWSDGSPALNDREITSFTATDALIAYLAKQYVHAQEVAIAGFSAGGQFVQRYAAFGSPPRSLEIRYVVSDPSSFVYFDTYRPLTGVAGCPEYNNWKYGLEHMPAWLGRSAAAARAHYTATDLRYLEGSLDAGETRESGRDLLETGCQAELQGPYRLDRGENYATYDAKMLAHGRHALAIVPGCGHNVTCVFPNPAARDALFGTD